MSVDHVTLSVGGMHCGSCAKLVERALKATPGVTAANVVLVKQQAIVEFDPKQVTLDALRRTVVAQGYSVTDAVPVASIPTSK